MWWIWVGAALAGPEIVLAEEHEEEPAGGVAVSSPLGSTTIGGYGQFDVSFLRVGPDAPFSGEATVRRFVVELGHDFAEKGVPISMYAELEWEHAIACATCEGSVEIEQGFLDWELRGEALGLRTGLILVPMGIINQWHEPPVFHGVDRPAVERIIIPSTWRELGLGLYGQPTPWLRYEAYLMTAVDPTALGTSGLVGARTVGSKAPANAGALSARVEVEPTLGAVVGASGYASDLGAAGGFHDALGQEKDLLLPLLGWDVDARLRRWGLEARALYASFHMPESDDLIEAYKADGSPWFPEGATSPVPTLLHGGYGELAYDVLFPLREVDHQLLPFARVEYYDTQARVPEGTTRDPSKRVWEYTYGLTYKPIPQVAFKADVQLRDRQRGYDELQINGGMGFVY